MEKNQEVLGRLVVELKLQNKLLAMKLVISMGIENFSLLEDEQKISVLNKKADNILKNTYIPI